MGNDETVQQEQFLIRIRKGDWEVEVSGTDKSFVLDESSRLIEQFRLNNANFHSSSAEVIEGQIAHLDEPSQSKILKPQSLNEFFRQFKLQTHLDKILVLGYWCEIRQGQPHFTSEDVLAKYKEAKEPPPANIRRDLGSLLSKGLLLSAGKSEDGSLAYELTNTGIKEVESKISGT